MSVTFWIHGVVSCFICEKEVGVINYKNEKVDFDIGKQIEVTIFRKSKRFQKESDNLTNTEGRLREKFLAFRRLCTRDIQRYSLFRVKGEKKSR